MRNALTKIQEVNTEFAKISGRTYGNGLIDPYKLEDAEIAIVVIGSTAGTLKVIVDQLRQDGIKAGILRLRTFRPLPVEDLRNALKDVKAIAVMDKSMVPGGFGGADIHFEDFGDLSDLFEQLGGRVPRATPPAARRPGRNDPCPCGSQRKYKRCCAHGPPM